MKKMESKVDRFFYFVVDLDHEVTIRFESSLLPRVSDTIALGDVHLKVLDVVIQTANNGGCGILHSIHVLGRRAELDRDSITCQEMEFQEYLNYVKEKSDT